MTLFQNFPGKLMRSKYFVTGDVSTGNELSQPSLHIFAKTK